MRFVKIKQASLASQAQQNSSSLEAATLIKTLISSYIKVAASKNISFFKASIFILPLFIILLFLSCTTTPSKESVIQPGFYHWQTILDINPIENRYLDSLQTQKLYIKFFDIDWDFNQQAPLPHASLQVQSPVPKKIAIIPTIFITNRTFQQIAVEDLEDLSNKVVNKLEEQFRNFPNHTMTMIQLDCDWSLSTKEKYFQFLALLQKGFATKNISLSTTIRLHQIKYFEKTGIPPVQRGLLMFYNMGEVMDSTTQNSILDLSIARQYISRLEEYPLPLDLALPLFQWGVLFRDGKMIQLINQLKKEELADERRFKKIGPYKWQVLKNTYLNGFYLYKTDWIRIEKVTYPELQKAVEILQPYFQTKSYDLLFYHLEEEVISGYKIDQLQSLLMLNEEF